MALKSSSPKVTILLAVAASSCLLLGACSDRRAAGYTAHRTQNIKRTLELAERRERESPRNLSSTLDTFAELHRQSQRHLRRDLARLRARSEAEVNDWSANQPAYRAGLRHFFGGRSGRDYGAILGALY